MLLHSTKIKFSAKYTVKKKRNEYPTFIFQNANSAIYQVKLNGQFNHWFFKGKF